MYYQKIKSIHKNVLSIKYIYMIYYDRMKKVKKLF